MLYNLSLYNFFSIILYRNPEVQDTPTNWIVVILVIFILIGGGILTDKWDGKK